MSAPNYSIEAGPHPAVEWGRRERRERIATAVLQGLLAGDILNDISIEDTLADTIALTDALIVELDK